MPCPARRMRSNLSVQRWPLAAALALAVSLAAATLAQPAQAQTESVIYSFKGGANDGGYPSAGVIRDAAGNLYGTTWLGGAVDLGTVFEISKHGETLLHSFRGGADGKIPLTGLIRDTAGNLYGTTSGGGTSGWGTVFKLSVTAKETMLHSFTGPTTDGGYPLAGLILDTKGNLYGTTYSGGTNNVGTVFKAVAAGNETVLHSFTGGVVGGTDGATPNGGVVRDSAGNLYGATLAGGPQNAGIVFKVDATGNETILYSFTGGNGGADGKYPMGNLVRDAAGNLYGITNIGGTANRGTIFKVDPTGKETVLHNFGFPGDGGYPQSGLVADAAGNLYGSADGGTFNYGVVFKFNTASGTETILYNFGGATGDGQYPIGSLAVDTAGNVYGTTQQGGKLGWGTVFKITP
jgi:uncharacterized repeat protein (TIGR03803 family)